MIRRSFSLNRLTSRVEIDRNLSYFVARIVGGRNDELRLDIPWRDNSHGERSLLGKFVDLVARLELLYFSDRSVVHVDHRVARLDVEDDAATDREHYLTTFSSGVAGNGVTRESLISDRLWKVLRRDHPRTARFRCPGGATRVLGLKP